MSFSVGLLELDFSVAFMNVCLLHIIYVTEVKNPQKNKTEHYFYEFLYHVSLRPSEICTQFNGLEQIPPSGMDSTPPPFFVPGQIFPSGNV